VIIDAEHLCVSSRGIEDGTSSTITAAYRGRFKEDAVKQEFQKYLSL
jgi:GTP cyclohydrolase I